MCEFCKEHGEGKKWYLQAKNYSEELFNEERKLFMTEFYEKFEEMVATALPALDKIPFDPDTAKAIVPPVVEQFKKTHYGQIVPIEDIEQIFDMSLSIVRLPCLCRSALLGRRDDRYCFGLTTFQSDFLPATFLKPYPDYSPDLEELPKEEAKKAIRKHDHNGLIHSVWTFLTPFIGGICNCTTKECMAMKFRLRVGVPVFFKAEYVASIDWESCNGCRDCMKVCNFGAVAYSPTLQKCYINQRQCYGCGVCRAVCSRDAITLHDRNAIPVLANEW